MQPDGVTAAGPLPAVEAGDAEVFKRLWRGFGSTVAVVATELNGERFAMLATAATSVSMDPPSLLVCVNRSASAHAAITARGAFSLGILPAEHHAIGTAIARASSTDRFAHGSWQSLDEQNAQTKGLPWLRETQATLFCVTDTSFEYGTHTLFIARVIQAIGACGDNPLMYCDGRFGGFQGIAA